MYKKLWLFFVSIVCITSYNLDAAEKRPISDEKHIYGVNVKFSQQLINQQQESPVTAPLSYGLTECTQSTCPLTRKRKLGAIGAPYFAHVRKCFENAVVKHITDNFSDKGKQFVYTSFGSGWLLQDFLIINKLLQAGFTHLTLNFIDPLYQSTMAQIPQSVKTKGQEKITQFTATNITSSQGILMNLLAFAMLNNNAIAINIFSSAEDYREACHNDSSLKASALVCTDTLTSNPFQKPPFDDFYTIFTDAMQPHKAFFYVLEYPEYVASMFIAPHQSKKQNFIKQYLLIPELSFQLKTRLDSAGFKKLMFSNQINID